MKTHQEPETLTDADLAYEWEVVEGFTPRGRVDAPCLKVGATLVSIGESFLTDRGSYSMWPWRIPRRCVRRIESAPQPGDKALLLDDGPSAGDAGPDDFRPQPEQDTPAHTIAVPEGLDHTKCLLSMQWRDVPRGFVGRAVGGKWFSRQDSPAAFHSTTIVEVQRAPEPSVTIPHNTAAEALAAYDEDQPLAPDTAAVIRQAMEDSV
jgi:hypothetical protein